jgi:predicted ester cyclase
MFRFRIKWIHLFTVIFMVSFLVFVDGSAKDKAVNDVKAVQPVPIPASDAGVKPTTPESNRDLIQRYINGVFNQGNQALLNEFVDPVYVDHSFTEPSQMGIEGLRKSISELRMAFPDGRFTIEKIIVEGNDIAVHSTFTGTQAGLFNGFPPPRHPVTTSSIDLYRIKENKIIEHWGGLDEAALLRQSGFLPQVHNTNVATPLPSPKPPVLPNASKPLEPVKTGIKDKSAAPDQTGMTQDSSKAKPKFRKIKEIKKPDEQNKPSGN